jgi:transcriptional regulator GlxA family with amidase domain
MHRLWRVPLGELADVTGVSARRVQMAFQQVANVSPTAYMRARALQAVRDRLLDPRHRTANITGIALDHGFEHLGRFSSYYREMFGERPSATLRERYPNAA